MNDLVKKGFLQACMNHGSLDMGLIMKILAPMCEANEADVPDENGVRTFVKSINEEISQYDQQLTFVKHPLAGKEYLVFGYTVISDISKWQSCYTDQDRLYFRLVLDATANAESYGISWIDATNLSSNMQGKPFAKSHSQELLQRWIKQGYYIEKGDNIYWGPRMMAEFDTYLKTHYPEDVKNCSLCSKLVLWDTCCAECETRFHCECIRKFLTKSSHCPECRKTWNKPITPATVS